MAPYCVYRWDGISQNKIEDHCPEDEQCDTPPNPPDGALVGQLTFVLCVPK